jgi:SAM-dependent methyltransferase
VNAAGAVITVDARGRGLVATIEATLQLGIPVETLALITGADADRSTHHTLGRLEDAGHPVFRERSVARARNQAIRALQVGSIILADAADRIPAGFLGSLRYSVGVSLSAGIACGGWITLFDGSLYCGPTDAGHILGAALVPRLPFIRRAVWERTGGFDETLPGRAADIDFWIAAREKGFDAVVMESWDTAQQSTGYDRIVSASELQALYAKWISVLNTAHESILDGKHRVIASVERRCRDLETIRRDKNAELQILDGRVAEERRRRGQSRNTIDFGDLRRTSPISPIWGLDRGKPLDRIYIESFLERHRDDITGRVLEVKDDGYSRTFGTALEAVDILDVDSRNPAATVVCDLTRAVPIPNGFYDCFVLTQTLGLVFDVAGALREACRILKPGGVLLCTVPACGRISYEEGLDADFWRFTEASLRRLFSAVFPIGSFEIQGHGNVLVSTAFLYGLPPESLTTHERDLVDPAFPCVYTIRAVRPCRWKVSLFDQHEAPEPCGRGRRILASENGGVEMISPDESALYNELAKMQAEIDALRSSRSWRLTSPLRRLYDALLALTRK